MRAPRYRPASGGESGGDSEAAAYPIRRHGPAHGLTHRPLIRNLGRRFTILESSSVFASAPDHVLYTLARRLQRLTVPGGGLVVRQGEAGQSLYMIDSGLCQVAVEGADGGALPVAMLGPGDCFGEGALVGEADQEFSVQAIKPTQVYTLDRESLLEEVPPRSVMYRRIVQMAEQRRTMRERLITQQLAIASRQGAEVVSIYSAKGGSGRTTLAVNLAARLGKRDPGGVLLLDLSIPYHHAALVSNLAPSSSLAMAATVPEAHFEEAIAGAIVHHKDGMAVLTAALRPPEADLVTPAVVNRALGVVTRTFRYVVIDLGTALTDIVLTTFDQSQRIVLVTPPEISALKDTAELIKLMPTALHVPSTRTTVVLNHRSRSELLDAKAVERGIGCSIDVEILHDGAKPEQAALAGEILALTSPSTALARGAATLAGQIESDRRRRLDATQHLPEVGLSLTEQTA